jgi:uncharacterized membrane protein YebE (DUF533 family)
MLHYAAYGAFVGIAKVGTAVGKGALAAHQFLSAHAAVAAASGTGAFATVAYVDYKILSRWYSENPPPAKLARTVKFAIGGNLVKGEFTTVIDAERPTAVLQGYIDEATQDVVKSRVVRPRRLESGLAESLAGGRMLVFA